MIQCDCNIIVVSWIQLLVSKNFFQVLFFLFNCLKMWDKQDPKMCSILAWNVQNQTPLGTSEEYTTLPRPPSREELLALSNRTFAPSAHNSPLAPQTKISALLAPKHKILEPPLCGVCRAEEGHGSSSFLIETTDSLLLPLPYIGFERTDTILDYNVIIISSELITASDNRLTSLLLINDKNIIAI